MPHSPRVLKIIPVRKWHSIALDAYLHSWVLILIPAVFVGDRDCVGNVGAPAVLGGDDGDGLTPL